VWGEIDDARFYRSYDDEGPTQLRVYGELTIVRMLHEPLPGLPSRWVVFSGHMPDVRRREVVAALS
jgi:hypothetical protein